MASGSAEAIAGSLAFSLHWQPSAYAATAATGEQPQTIGRLSDSASANSLPGLTKVSLAGRHFVATSSSRDAVASSASGARVGQPELRGAR